MAKSSAERSADTAKKRELFDEKEFRFRSRLGIRQKLDDLMAWNNIEEMNEAVQNLILNAHALGPTLSYQAIESPRHKIQVSENVARMIKAAGQRQASRLDAEEA